MAPFAKNLQFGLELRRHSPSSRRCKQVESSKTNLLVKGTIVTRNINVSVA
jgi:hypothetical protein